MSCLCGENVICFVAQGGRQPTVEIATEVPAQNAFTWTGLQMSPLSRLHACPDLLGGGQVALRRVSSPVHDAVVGVDNLRRR